MRHFEVFFLRRKANFAGATCCMPTLWLPAHRHVSRKAAALVACMNTNLWGTTRYALELLLLHASSSICLPL